MIKIASANFLMTNVKNKKFIDIYKSCFYFCINMLSEQKILNNNWWWWRNNSLLS